MSAKGKIRIAIVGGGVSGLSCAREILAECAHLRDKLEIVILEASPKVGGVIETLDWQDCHLESGPDMFITSPPYLKDLVDKLGLTERLIKVQDGPAVGGALVLRKGKLHKVPDGFVMLAPSKLLPFALSPLVSPLGKLRALLEPLVPARKQKEDSETKDESLAQFVRRRFGREVLENLAQPMVAGIYVGDAEKLSAQCVASRFVEMERTAGSVTNSLLKSAAGVKAAGARYGLFASFDQGMSVLTETLARLLSPSIRLSTKVVGVERKPKGANSNRPGFLLKIEKSDATGTEKETLECHYLVLALAAAQSGALLKDINREMAALLERIPAASSAVVNMVFERKDLKPFERKYGRPFGALVPESERGKTGISAIAVSFASNKFAGRAPEEKLVLRVFFKDGLEAADKDMKVLALRDLQKLHIVKKDLEPLYWAVHRYREAMPQYNLGHKQLVAQLEALCASEEGVFLAGASYQGVGLPDCVNSGNLCAQRLLSELYASNLNADLGEVHERQT